MLSFAQFSLMKKLEDDSLHMKRSDMPQIFDDDTADFDQFLYDEKITYFNQWLSPFQLRASQDEFNIPTLEHLMSKPVGTSKVITSSDKFIVDGHHRVLAAMLTGIKLIECTEIELPLIKLLEVFHAYDKVGHLSVNDSLV